MRRRNGDKLAGDGDVRTVGLPFGGFFLMAIFGALVVMWRVSHEHEAIALTERGYRLEKLYLIVLAALGWAAVLSGTYVVYPWYRAAACRRGQI